jgi:uncharacterized protein YqgC (DUF456 family)
MTEIFANTLPLIAWIILAIGVILGTIGTVIPGLPGAFFIVISILVHKYLLPDIFSWALVSVIIVLALLTAVVDFFMTYLGAKLGGATRFGIYGATIGGFIGLFGGLPGLVIGPFLGAIAGDLYGKRRELSQLIRSGIGASLSLVFALVARLVLLLIMLVVIIFGIVF